MSKNNKLHDYHIFYNINVNGEEYSRDYVVHQAVSKTDAENKLKKLCGDSSITITENIEL